jgi:hypothetical protein
MNWKPLLKLSEGDEKEKIKIFQKQIKNSLPSLAEVKWVLLENYLKNTTEGEEFKLKLIKITSNSRKILYA